MGQQLARLIPRWFRYTAIKSLVVKYGGLASAKASITCSNNAFDIRHRLLREL